MKYLAGLLRSALVLVCGVGASASWAGQLSIVQRLPGSLSGPVINSLSVDGSKGAGITSLPTVPDVAIGWTSSSGVYRLPFSSTTFDADSSGISGDGHVIVGSASNESNGTTAVAWNGTAQPTALWSNGTASKASYDGSVIVGYQGITATAWSASTGAISLGYLSGQNASFAVGVSGSGKVVVGYSGQDGFRWTQTSGMTDLGTAPGFLGSAANAISLDGATIACSVYNSVPTYGERGALWNAKTGFTVISDSYFQPGAITGNGSEVIGTWLEGSTFASAIWIQGQGIIDFKTYLASQGLPVSTFAYVDASAISADGRTVAGRGFTSGGQEVDFVAHVRSYPAPAPVAAIPFLMGLLRRRRRG